MRQQAYSSPEELKYNRIPHQIKLTEIRLIPYVGIIQIRLWVKAIQLTLSLLTQAPLVLIVHIVTF